MIAIDSTHEHPSSSLARFFASHAKAYHAMANAPMRASSADTRTMVDYESEEMHRLNKSGATISEIARKYNMTPSAVSNRLKRRGMRIYYHSCGRRPM